MKYRLLYPGIVKQREVVLITGSIYTGDLLIAGNSLAEGSRSIGLSTTLCCPGRARPCSRADQVGNPGDWSFDYDLIIIVLGEYLGGERFRFGALLPAITRTVFFTPVAEHSITPKVELSWESERRESVLNYLSDCLPGPITLARPSLVRLSEAEVMLQNTNSDVLLAMEHGLPADPTLGGLRTSWADELPMSCVPALERALW